MSKMESVSVNVQEYQSHFSKYSYLWMDGKTKYMKQFLLYGEFLTTKQLESSTEYEHQKCIPKLAHFKAQVLQFLQFVFLCLVSIEQVLNHYIIFQIWLKIQGVNDIFPLEDHCL